MRILIRNLFIILSVVVLSTCGGGGGDSDSGTGGVSFTVNLTSVDIVRVSNGDSVNVDTSGITSGTLTLNQ